jgi:hypothetical protein
VVSNTNIMLAYDHNLNELWRVNISDQTGASGPAGFDFEGNGTQEVVYSDEGSVHVFNQAGSSVYQASRASVTMFESTAIADINNDGHANMVTGSNEPNLGLADGVDMLGNTGTSWVHARGIWNQHAYIEALVSEVGTPIPATSSLEPLDGFRTASAMCQ